MWDRDRQTGPATPWNSVCSWREPPMLSTRLAGTPQILPAWESHPKFSKEGPANASPKAATCCLTPGVGLARAGGGILTPRTAETGSTCATALPPQGAREESCWDCKSRVSRSHAEEAPLQKGFVPIPCLCSGCWTTATFGKRRPGCTLWLKFGGFLLAKPLQNQSTWE